MAKELIRRVEISNMTSFVLNKLNLFGISDLLLTLNQFDLKALALEDFKDIEEDTANGKIR